jgi:hypothetical protein
MFSRMLDLRLPEACTRIVYQLSLLPELRPRLLRIVPELIDTLDPSLPYTNATRILVLKTLVNLSIPFVGFDERVPNVREREILRYIYIYMCVKYILLTFLIGDGYFLPQMSSVFLYPSSSFFLFLFKYLYFF